MKHLSKTAIVSLALLLAAACGPRSVDQPDDPSQPNQPAPPEQPEQPAKPPALSIERAAYYYCTGGDDGAEVRQLFVDLDVSSASGGVLQLDTVEVALEGETIIRASGRCEPFGGAKPLGLVDGRLNWRLEPEKPLSISLACHGLLIEAGHPPSNAFDAEIAVGVELAGKRFEIDKALQVIFNPPMPYDDGKRYCAL